MKRVLFAALLAAGLSLPAQANNLIEVLNNPDPHPFDLFGFSLAANKKRLAIGSPYDSDTSFTQSGSVYVYDLNKKGNVLRPVPDPEPDFFGSLFGATVAFSGKRLFVGDVALTQTVTAPVKVYQFDKKTDQWVEVGGIDDPAPLSPPDLTFFGDPLAIAGRTLVVGGSDYPGQPPDTYGRVDIFQTSKSGATHRETIVSPSPFQPPPNGADMFFFAEGVALLNPNTLVTASLAQGPNPDSPPPFLYDPSYQQYNLKKGSVPRQPTIAVSDDTTKTATSPGQRTVVTVGPNVVTGNPNVSSGSDLGVGEVTSTRTNKKGEVVQQKIKPPAEDVETGLNFGAVLATDGKKLYIGAPGAIGGTGRVYVYKLIKGQWTLVDKILSPIPFASFGESIAPLTPTSVAIGAPFAEVGGEPGAGAVCLFEVQK